MSVSCAFVLSSELWLLLRLILRQDGSKVQYLAHLQVCDLLWDLDVYVRWLMTEDHAQHTEPLESWHDELRVLAKVAAASTCHLSQPVHVICPV